MAGSPDLAAGRATPSVRESAPASRRCSLVACVAVVFTVAQLVLVVPGSGLGWDEVVYVSQVGHQAPAAFFSAPRARGVPLLVAPVTLISSATPVIRVYLALLSGAALFLCFRVWRTLLPGRVLALAALLFASLWITLFYGPEAMPDLWSAFAALAAVGCFLRLAGTAQDRWAAAGLLAGVAGAALVRPLDGLWLALPLAVAAALVPRWRRPAVFVLLAAGLVLGAGEWVVEAFVRYGGLTARLHRSSVIQGGMGLHLAVVDQLRSLDGRALCRPCTVPLRHPLSALWWAALPLGAVGGYWAAVRARRPATAVLPIAVAASLSLPYLFLIDYAAPRFLLPAYALLALPVADVMCRLPGAVPGRWRAVVATALVLLVAAHLAVQLQVLTRAVARNDTDRADWARAARELHGLGVRPPCLVTGNESVPIAYYAGCASRETSGYDASITPAGVLAAARRESVALVMAAGSPLPAYARTWHRRPVPPHRGSQAYAVFTPEG